MTRYYSVGDLLKSMGGWQMLRSMKSSLSRIYVHFLLLLLLRRGLPPRPFWIDVHALLLHPPPKCLNSLSDSWKNSNMIQREQGQGHVEKNEPQTTLLILKVLKLSGRYDNMQYVPSITRILFLFMHSLCLSSKYT